jgi:putative alpha-1,2-mannosidase
VLLALLLAGCDGSSPSPQPDVSPPAEPRGTDEFPHLERVRLTAPEDLAAVAPFGLMRIAVSDRSSKTGLSFSHGRVAGAPDLVMTLHNLSSPGAADAAVNRQVSGAPESGGIGAAPGRLVAFLPDQALVAEATTRGRLAIYRVTVPQGDTLEIRLAWRSPANAVSVWAPARGRQALNGTLMTDAGAELHAAVRFDDSFTVVNADSDISRLRFTPAAGVMELRLALSTTDLAGARDNLADGDGLGFEGVLRSTRNAWDALLGRFTVVAGDEVKARTATDWYRVLANYGKLEDRDGRYRAPDGSLRRVADGQGFIGNLDLWREQWTVLPLIDLLAPELLQGLPETLLLHQRVTGHFPDRTAWGRMLFGQDERSDGSSIAPAVLAGFVSRRGTEADAERMLPPVIKASRGAQFPTGFVPFDGNRPPSVSRTLAVSRGSQAVAVIAARARDRDTAGAFAARAVFYRLLYDPGEGTFRGKDRAGRWRSPFPPTPDRPAAFEDFSDGRWAEALWVPALFDIDGLLELLGGQQALEARLDAAFSAGPGEAGLDATRPPMQHTPWLYGFTNHPERIAKRLEEAGASRNAPGADAAAWRLFRVLGLYPVLPAEGEYMLAPPAVREARLEVEGRSLRLVAPGKGSGVWRGGVRVDGQLLPGRLVSHSRLARGGLVSFDASTGDGDGQSVEK